MTELFKCIWAVCPHSDELTDRLTEALFWRYCPRKSHVLRPGQICRSLYFVESGLFRTYYNVGKKNISSGFMREGDICIVPDSFFSQRPGREGIEVIESGMLSLIPYDDLQEIYGDFPHSSAGARRLLEDCLVSQRQRMIAMWMQRAGDRYDWFVREFPDLTARVPAKYIASYLGLTEVTLSIIKNGREKWSGRSGETGSYALSP